MTNKNRSTTDQILDLLLDALQERQSARQQEDEPVSETSTLTEMSPIVAPAAVLMETPQPENEPVVDEFLADEPQTPTEAPESEIEAEGEAAWEPAFFKEPGPPEPLPSIQLDQMLRRLAVAVGVIIILINIPFNRSGLSLARAMPDAQSLIIRDGLVLKGSSEKIYVLENNQKRWISSLEAFAFFGYSWEQVNVVDDAFLNQFEDGRPLYILLKCQTSPHIYALEDGQKRWIKDIATFEAQGFVWEDVKFVSCGELRRLPTGTPIPPDAGPSPEP
ncbi:MAG: hypothetical protein IPM53_09760 [Anaerolineaceae bacterium]|nr:hypothetical protein [Anaerolineaceae bacterium]